METQRSREYDRIERTTHLIVCILETREGKNYIRIRTNQRADPRAKTIFCKNSLVGQKLFFPIFLGQGRKPGSKPSRLLSPSISILLTRLHRATQGSSRVVIMSTSTEDRLAKMTALRQKMVSSTPSFPELAVTLTSTAFACHLG